MIHTLLHLRNHSRMHFSHAFEKILKLHMQAYANNNLTASNLATCAYVSSKSIRSSGL